ncbi:hypothetical protein [Photorhabdus temperata]|uniref:Uncharacterized protein n=1 Tax=Photorhabdus temperata J3 TaxID=1389415 RepID=U7R5N4_PHOTE|nr:hypothetical protein [Photorhabdus temperata]ERT14910.1 hypothetical protein O185_01215 [Photorhabdus temperata J3]
MQYDEKIPRTARDALIIELLGDVGTIHDQIKNLPTEIEQAISGSIKLVADAVEDAENTALKLAKSIEVQKNTTIKDIDEAVKNSLEQHTAKIFSDIDEKVKSLQHKINNFDLADPKGRRLSFILATTLIIVSFCFAAAIYGIYTGANSRVKELTLIISAQDTKEKRGLSVLTPQAREQYQAATQNTSSN